MANIFSKATDMYKLVNEANQMKNKLKEKIVSGYSKNEDVEVRLNGNFELENIEISEELLAPVKKTILEKAIEQAHKDAIAKLQKELQKDVNLDELRQKFGI